MCKKYGTAGQFTTHQEFVILIDFPQQQFLIERAPELRYTYIACLGMTLQPQCP
jgi:hypothetical protein